MSDNLITKALITGVTGSGGSYLAEHIIKNYPDVEVHGLSRWHSTSTADNLRQVREKISVHECDLNDQGSVIEVLQKVKPDAIFHLASHANVRASFITPGSVLSNNILGTSNLFEAVRILGLDPVIQLCSTSEVYGQVRAEDVPITEGAPLQPASPYAVSKAAQDLLGRVYFKSYGMKIVRTRMFTYLNPRRTDLFATAFAKQVALIECGLQKELVHGNLDSVRTIIDVRDAMSAYWLATTRGVYGEVYNIGGVTTMTVGDFLNKLIGMANTAIPTRVNPDLLRPSDVTLQIPCCDKFVEHTGWKPTVPFEESIKDLLTHWRGEAAVMLQRCKNLA